MTDCQLANYLADVAFFIKMFSWFGIPIGGMGVLWSYYPPKTHSSKWLPIVSIVSIIAFVLLIIFVPNPKVIIFGCDKIGNLF